MNKISQQILEKTESLPPHIQQEVIDFIDFLKYKNQTNKPLKEPNGTAMAQLMEEIAARGIAFKDIKDPSAWQREIRKDI